MKDNPAVRWVFDHPEYEFTGIRYYGQYKPARLEVTPLLGPAEEIAPGESFTSCRAFEMLPRCDRPGKTRTCRVSILAHDGSLDTGESDLYARKGIK